MADKLKGRGLDHDPVYGRSEFERSLVMQEAAEREAARVKYVLGIQGRDGGKCYDVHTAPVRGNTRSNY